MSQVMKYHKWAFIFPILAVLIWSLNIVVTRYVSDYISPVSISFYRWLIAFTLYTTNFTEPLSYQGSAFLKLPKFP
ncbi:EamA family transporter, partial [Acinetobacter baumannii]|uniref:EamA family transporter n=3 Tax=Acinetobacter baumannii TaxID=470 RepID=UPI001D0D47E3